jgi:hypothetical protein
VASRTVTVAPCDDITVVAVNASRVHRAPPPVMHVLGAAATGARSFTLPPSTLPPAASAAASSGGAAAVAWSMSALVWLWDGPTGEHRSLFYKGSGKDNRTPSAWLLPDAMKLAVRVSHAAETNEGADTTVALRPREWMHLAFTFRNVSATPALASDGAGVGAPVVAAAYNYVLEVYVNGELDCSMSFAAHILANDGPLSFGKDPWFPGTRMLVMDLKLFDMALTKADVVSESRAAMQLVRPLTPLDGAAGWLPGADPRRRSVDGIVRAASMVASWGQLPAALAPSNATVAAEELLAQCDADYIGAMEVGALCCAVTWCVCVRASAADCTLRVGVRSLCVLRVFSCWTWRPMTAAATRQRAGCWPTTCCILAAHTAPASS